MHLSYLLKVATGRLILKIKNETTGEIFIYKTEFIISDDVGEEIEKLAASA